MEIEELLPITRKILIHISVHFIAIVHEAVKIISVKFKRQTKAYLAVLMKERK